MDECKEISLLIRNIGCSQVHNRYVALIKAQLSKYLLKDTIILLQHRAKMEEVILKP